jgi:phosphoglucosamine mutase
MNNKLFGTDGVRGRANIYPITPEIALLLGKAIAHVFQASGRGEKKAVVGKDTRLSCYMLEAALIGGLLSKGMDTMAVGPMPTPALAHLTKSFNASCGIMITASHNPADDNGIKIFDADGFKLPDAMEAEIEEYVFRGNVPNPNGIVDPIGRAYRIDDARGRYIEFAKASVRNRSLRGLKLVLDCANGAAYSMAPLIFKELGAEVITAGVSPNGLNINAECGAMHPEAIRETVLNTGADVGITLDGDADRVIFLDAAGQVVNGDRILGMCALDMHRRKRLENDTLVVTSMSNLGLHKAMEEAGIRTITTDVGDRHVIESMRENGCNVGGEQSGHIIFMDYVTTGDGIITALHVLKQMQNSGKSLAELADCMQEYPQRLESICIKEKKPFEEMPTLQQIISRCREDLGKRGRTVVRYSGTENKIRVLLEAETNEMVNSWTEQIVAVIRKELC